jgi:hypothetical protein
VLLGVSLNTGSNILGYGAVLRVSLNTGSGVLGCGAVLLGVSLNTGSGVLGCGAVLLGVSFLMSLRIIVPSSSMVKQSTKIGIHLPGLLEPWR